MFSSYIIFYFSERFINGSLQGFPWGGEKMIVLCCLFLFLGKKLGNFLENFLVSEAVAPPPLCAAANL